jgi:hypothetical protein
VAVNGGLDYVFKLFFIVIGVYISCVVLSDSREGGEISRWSTTQMGRKWEDIDG